MGVVNLSVEASFAPRKASEVEFTVHIREPLVGFVRRRIVVLNPEELLESLSAEVMPAILAQIVGEEVVEAFKTGSQTDVGWAVERCKRYYEDSV